ncbi:MAG TPA: 3-hydroxybutyryl-CoA dehydrogenase [Acidimicrobiales bacterium]|jgi:3-hydroxybutyryl-CoA dehydrogenase
MELERVGVVGCGLMGSGIAEVCARAGLDTVVVEVDDGAVAAGRSRIERSIGRAVGAGKMSDEERDRAFDQLRFSTSYDDLADRQLVVEAVIEREAEKVAVFSRLDAVVEERGAVLASNTSSIPIMKLAMATKRPEAVVGIHFFNPVPVLKLVELVTSLLTSDETVDTAEKFAEGVLGKHVIRSQDRAGFIVNALLIPYLLSAIRMLESGFATREDIDAGMVEGCAHPMGPLALTDLIGLDTTMAVAESLYEEFKEQLYAPPPLLARMVDAGLLGRKAGRGFYDYRKPA